MLWWAGHALLIMIMRACNNYAAAAETRRSISAAADRGVSLRPIFAADSRAAGQRRPWGGQRGQHSHDVTRAADRNAGMAAGRAGGGNGGSAATM